jgi:hypothetical protein
MSPVLLAFRVAAGRIPEVRAFPLKIDFFYKLSAVFICVSAIVDLRDLRSRFIDLKLKSKLSTGFKLIK